MKLGKKELDLHFGWDFLAEVNDTLSFEMEVDGQKIPTRAGGMAFLQMGLSQYDPITVLKVIKAGLSTAKQKPSNEELKQLIEDLLAEGPDKYKAFVDELFEMIKKEPMLDALAKVTADAGA